MSMCFLAVLVAVLSVSSGATLRGSHASQATILAPQRADAHQRAEHQASGAAYNAPCEYYLTEGTGGSCYIKDLLARSAYVEANAEGLVDEGEEVLVTCKAGYRPPQGQPNYISVKCIRNDADQVFFDTKSHLSCGLPCNNADLKSDLGAPVQSTGTTQPQGRMAMKCALTGLLPVSVLCMPDGTWSTAQPCMPCDTSALALREPSVQLSAHGMLLPQSIVQMRCPKDMYAHPAVSVPAMCLPGGQWSKPAFSCRSRGCDTADLLPGRVENDMEGRLAVGATAMVVDVQSVSGSVSSNYYTATCQQDGTWLKEAIAPDGALL